jgi:O-antigen ligase
MGAYAGLMFAILIALFNKRLSRKFFHFILILFVILLIIGFMLEPLFGVNFAEIVFIRTQAHILSLLNPLEGSGLESPYAKTSMANRYIRVKAAFEVWLNHPLIGVGINNFYYYYPTDVPARVHSGFTQSLAEMGLLGFIGLILIFGSTLINIRKYIHEMKEESPSSVILTAFYYIIWAEVFMVLVGEAWIKEEVWVNLSMAVLVFYRSERKMVKAGSYYRF